VSVNVNVNICVDVRRCECVSVRVNYQTFSRYTLTKMEALLTPLSACMFLILPNTVLLSYMQIENSCACVCVCERERVCTCDCMCDLSACA